ncbi:iron ABC transporter permease [Peptoniphilus sp. EMRHCC_23]|uniref:FecCD family ABC transporter permease n=1 Tax=Peptoniphilus rachelemmaiella TaxID=2811779 RepID=UPI001C007E94|nr:iron ABC transporter permease [Peptoniphilus rachelemmaiella]
MKRSVIFAGLTLLFVASVIGGLYLGYADLSLGEILHALSRGLFGKGGDDVAYAIVMDIRLPRVLLAILTGVALAVSGLIMQAVVGNPIADPYILGISSGASLGATLAIVLGLMGALGNVAVGISAFIFALLTSVGVMILSRIGGRATSERLILSGLALSAAASSVATLLVYTAKNRDAIREVNFWLMGSLSGAKMNQIAFIGPVILALCIFLATQSRNLNLLLLGDEVAYTLGKDLAKLRSAYIVAVSLLVGLVVYTSGTIGFVGLIVPHMARFLLGTNHRHLIPGVILLGASLLLWADVAARNALPAGELPTGVVVSVVGAPFFVYLIVKNSREVHS